MSNRGFGILGFIVFMIVFVYEMETLKDHTSRAIYDVGNNLARAQQVVQPANNRTEGMQTALALLIANNLSYMSEVANQVVGKLHPDLKDELRYSAFNTSIKNRKSSAGILRFDPLKNEFKDDYEKLKTRYEAEHPGERVE